jgi:hypothetical protein
VEVKKDKTYFIHPIIGGRFTRLFLNMTKLSHSRVNVCKRTNQAHRLLTAHHEAFGAARVGSSGVKFDLLKKTKSGQPIFAVMKKPLMKSVRHLSLILPY